MSDFSNNENYDPQEYSFRVGNITSQGVTLVDNEYNIIQLPYSMLPRGSKSGSVIKLTLMRDIELERKQQQQLNNLIQKLQTGNNDNIVDQNIENSSQLCVEDDKDQQVESQLNQKRKKQLQQAKRQQKKIILTSNSNAMKKKPISSENSNPTQKLNDKNDKNNIKPKSNTNINLVSRELKSTSKQKQIVRQSSLNKQNAKSNPKN